MNTVHLCLTVITAIYFIASNDASSPLRDSSKLTLRGRVIFPSGSSIPVESGAKLTVELQDTARAGAPAITIARGTNNVIRFPISFIIKYLSKQVTNPGTYTLHATIKNKKGELLYTNDVRVGVTPFGNSRTTSIDIPVILVKTKQPISSGKKWSELVGKQGSEAVRIIKRETGFTDVPIIKTGSIVTADFRTNRVRVFVDNRGIVSTVPSVG